MAWRTLRIAAAALGIAAGAGLVAIALLVHAGGYEVAADRPHLQPVYTLLELGLRQAVRRRARHIPEPPLDDPALRLRGAACFVAHCQLCHGAPGVPPAPAGLAMSPTPGPLVDAARHWRPRELLWIARHGIRMTGMPAWGGRLDDADLWAVTALVLALPGLSPADWRSLAAQAPAEACALPPAVTGEESDAPAGQSRSTPPADGRPHAAARRALQLHGCRSCHVIPGIVGSDRQVGPPLAGFGRQALIAGRWPNTPEQLARWIRDPQGLDPGTAMPPTGVSDADARAIAAYLLSLR